jgi:hypothetical protein
MADARILHVIFPESAPPSSRRNVCFLCVADRRAWPTGLSHSTGVRLLYRTMLGALCAWGCASGRRRPCNPNATEGMDSQIGDPNRRNGRAHKHFRLLWQNALWAPAIPGVWRRPIGRWRSGGDLCAACNHVVGTPFIPKAIAIFTHFAIASQKVRGHSCVF